MKILDFGLVSISQAAKHFGVSVPTLRRWDREGRLKPHSRTLGNHRRYKLLDKQKYKVDYARVSSHDQKSDLDTQSLFLQRHCDVVLKDLGSGLNCKKPRSVRRRLGHFNVGDVKQWSSSLLGHPQTSATQFTKVGALPATSCEENQRLNGL